MIRPKSDDAVRSESRMLRELRKESDESSAPRLDLGVELGEGKYGAEVTLQELMRTHGVRSIMQARGRELLARCSPLQPAVTRCSPL